MSDCHDSDLEVMQADPAERLLASQVMALLGREADREFVYFVNLHIMASDFEPDLPPEPRRRAARRAVAMRLIAMHEGGLGNDQ